jgi:hypothetical protein
MTRTQIHSLRSDLADSIAIELLETGATYVYGPQSTMVRVWNAIDRAAKLASVHVQTAHEAHGWLIVTVP